MRLLLHSKLNIDTPIEFLYIDEHNCLKDELSNTTLVRFLNIPFNGELSLKKNKDSINVFVNISKCHHDIHFYNLIKKHNETIPKTLLKYSSKPIRFYKNNIVSIGKYSFDVDKKKEENICKDDYITNKDGVIYVGYHCLNYINHSHYKKKLFVCTKKNNDLSQLFKEQLQGFIFYNECSDKSMLDIIKWDYVVYINTEVSKTIKTKKHALLIPSFDDSNYNEILKLYEPQACLNNRHNIVSLMKKIIYYKTFFKQKKVNLTKYEKKWAINIPENKLNMFFSFPGNFIFNRFINVSEFQEKYKCSNDTQCPICLDKLDSKNISITSCGHFFCKECIRENLRISNKCPMCRRKINKNSLTLVSDFHYKNEKIDYIKLRCKTKSVLLVSAFNSTLTNCKKMLHGTNLEYSNFSTILKKKLNMYEEIIVMDTNHSLFNCISNNKNVIVLNYK